MGKVLEPSVMDGEVRYPGVKVKLTGTDSNAFMIVGKVATEMRRAGVSSAECDTFRTEAFSGDYNHVIQTCMRWVKVR